MTSDDSSIKTKPKISGLIVPIFTAILWHTYIDQHGWGVQFVYQPLGYGLTTFALLHMLIQRFDLHHHRWIQQIFLATFCSFLYFLDIDVVHFCFLGALFAIHRVQYITITLPISLFISCLTGNIGELGTWLPLSLLLLLLEPPLPPQEKEVTSSISTETVFFTSTLVGLMSSAVLNHFWLVVTPDRKDILVLGGAVILLHGFARAWIRTELYALILPGMWILLGWMSVQQLTGIELSMALLTLITLLYSGLPRSPYTYVGIGLGLSSQSLFAHTLPEINGFILLSVLWLIFTERRTIIGLSVFLFGIIWFTERGPVILNSPSTIWTSYINRTPSHSIWDQNGWYLIEKSESSTEQLSTFVNKQNSGDIFVENTPITVTFNDTSNHAEFATLIQLWHTDSEQITILSDIAGHVNIAFQATDTQFHLQTDQDIRTQFIAEQQELSKTHWLKPNRIIHRATPTELIHELTQQDVVVEVVHFPWESTISTGLTSTHLNAVNSLLSNGGTYYLIIDLHSFPEGALEAVTQNVESVFAHCLYMLPKDNIDSLLILAQQKPFSFNKLKSPLGDDGITTLGRILTNGYPKSISPQKLPISAKDRPSIPFTHLTAMSSLTQAPNEIWPDLTEQDARSLKIEFEHHKEYLLIVEEGVKGNIEPIQNHNLPEELQRSLIQPHLQAAKRHIIQAQLEGQSSSEWGQAQRYALTAQMIAPTESEPWILLGEIALGEGLLDKAAEKFTHVYTKDPTSLPAINGLARIAGLKEDYKETESLLIEAQTVSPTNWTTHYNLAIFHQEHGTLETAFALLTKALELPNGDNQKTRIALVEYFIAQQRWTRGLLEIDRLIQQDAEPDAKLWFLRGRIHFGLEIWDKAEMDFRKATLADPNFHAARGSIGVIKMIQGDLEGAAQAFRATLRFDPNNDAARQNLQIVQERLSNPSNRTSP